MHTSSEQNIYIGEQVNSFADQTTSRRFNRPVDQPLQHNSLTSRTMNLNRMLSHGISMPVSGTWHPTDFRPDYLLLQPTPKRRRTSSGSTGLSRRYCTSSRNGHFSGDLPVHSSRNLSYMSEMVNHRFIRSLDSRNPENVFQNNIFMNARPIHQHWPQVLPTSQHPNRWQNELRQVTSLVSAAAVAAAAAAVATQNSTHYQQSFISPTTTVSSSEVPCPSSQHYVDITPRAARGFTSSRSSFVKRPNYQFSFSNGVGSNKRRSHFPDANETHSQIIINNGHSYHEFAVTDKDLPLPSPSSFSSSLTSALLCNPQLNSCPPDIIGSVSSCTRHNLQSESNYATIRPDSKNTINCSPEEESPDSIVTSATGGNAAGLIHRTVVEQLDLLTTVQNSSHPVLSSHDTDHNNDLLSFTYVTNCNTAPIVESNNNNNESMIKSIDDSRHRHHHHQQQQQPVIHTIKSNNIKLSQTDLHHQSSSVLSNKNPITSCFNDFNSNEPNSSSIPHCNIDENIQLTSPCFSHSELNESSTNFVMSSTSQTEDGGSGCGEEATVVAAAAVVASAAAHAVAAAAQAVSAAVHHRRASSSSLDQTISSQLNESILMHTIPNQSTIHHPLMNCSSSVGCYNNYPSTNQLVSSDLYHHHNGHSSMLHEHGLNYRQPQLLANLSSGNMLNSFSIQPSTTCNFSSSQSIFHPSNLYSSMSIDNRSDNFTCDSRINLHIPNICTGQIPSSSMLHPIIPAFSNSNGLTLIRSTNEFVNASYPLATVRRITSEPPDNSFEFTMRTSGFTGPHTARPHFITTPLTFSNSVESTLLNSNFSTPINPSHYHQSSVHPNLTTMATEVAAAVALAANHSSSSVINRCTDPSQISFLPNNIVGLSCGSSNPSFSPYFPPSFPSVTPIPLLPLRSPQLSVIGSSTLATTRGVNTLLQFLRLIHQRPDSYALPYYPSAMTATAGGSNQSVVVSASAGIANGTRVASAVTPPLLSHHPIVPLQASPITSATAAFAVAMAAAVALQQQNHRHSSSNAISMLTSSRVAPTTPSIPVPILHAHLYYPRNVTTVQQLHNAHQQCYHNHYGSSAGGGVQYHSSHSQRPASTPNTSASSCSSINPVNSLFSASSVGVSGGGTTSPACLSNLFPFLLAVPPPPTALLPLPSPVSNNPSTTNFAVSDLSETLFAHYTAAAAAAAAKFNFTSSRTGSNFSSYGGRGGSCCCAAAAAASVDQLLHLAVQLESNNGRGLSKEELESLPIRLYTSKHSDSLSGDKQNTTICNEVKTNAQNDVSECDRCMICLDDYADSQQIRQMRCLHEFHANCVDKWLKTKRTCPLCRADAFTGSQRKDDYF
ncbi:uncharacterized protein DC041_0008409 [Schistosoma bovis]|uniref:RING-type domain-containing protein n=1 Tax=Schistosoma bovis TaxID=6184 RepID=A0A430PZR1_SCHBO|nr:uncharacterized protein DC041_0008409 [Schistosoma bovis]